MAQHLTQIDVETRGAGLYDVTRTVAGVLAQVGFLQGLATVYCRHTSASLLIQENADPDVQTDLDAFFTRLVPEGMAWVSHTTEGPDDMPAHIRAALTQTVLSIPFDANTLLLGTWQGIYVFEHRRAPHRRTLAIHLSGV